LGRHEVGKQGAADSVPGTAAQAGGSAREPWTRQHKALAIFLGGSMVAVLILVAANSPFTSSRDAVAGAPIASTPVASALLGNAAAIPGAWSSLAQIANPAAGQATPAPAPSPSPSAPAPARGSVPKAPTRAASLAALPVNTALAGSEAVAWARAALAALDAPGTTANVQTMVDWFANEGTPHDFNNPLNLQTPYGGSTVSTANGSSPAIHIQAYPSPADFAAAFPIEMNNGSYPAIVAALKAGTGLEGSAATSQIAQELSVYSGGGYDSIPASGN
jgi:hypothetical protein